MGFWNLYNKVKDLTFRVADLEDGGTLPAVTSSDNGDVLTVVNGEWDKASPSGGGGVSIDLLWTNPESEEPFVSDTKIEIDLSDYDAVLVQLVIDNIYNTRVCGEGLVLKSDESYNITVCNWTDGNMARRVILSVEDTGVTFGNSRYLHAYNSYSDSIDNTILIPYRIFGVGGINIPT